MKHFMLLLLAGFIGITFLTAQETTTGKASKSYPGWPEAFTRVEIKSSLDGKTQRAMFYRSRQKEARPLIVSLHTWSGDYLQEDPLAEEVLLRDWNYIHPDFRGPNNQPEACGSEQVIADIEDAIHFAIEHARVDSAEVHIIGVSGGGYTTLMSYFKLDYPVKSFHAWAPVTNLVDWYWECTGRGLEYARDLEQVTTGGKGFDPAEAGKRSPDLMQVPAGKRNNASLCIYAGVHDGYTGSVPVSHSINMYNNLVRQIYPEDTAQIVSDSLLLVLLEKRLNPSPDTCLYLGDRKVYLYRELPRLRLTIFDGGHEMIAPEALSLLPVDDNNHSKKLNILTIGDSNGASPTGWPAQLKKLLPYSRVINESVPGNTIGFDNLDNPKLNTLKNIHAYIDSALRDLPPGQQIDYVIFGLGTNDAKKVFNNRVKEVPRNLDSLLSETKQYFQLSQRPIPKLVVLSPPPMNARKADPGKYGGGDQRIARNIVSFEKIARQQDAIFVDVHSNLGKCPEEITSDGVHLTPKAQFTVAGIIADEL